MDEQRKLHGSKKHIGRYIEEKKDIKYRGPLSYRHLRIIGWSCFVLAQIGVLLTFAGYFDPSFASSTKGWVLFFNHLYSLLLPLLLMASFSIILNGNRGYKNLILLYGAGAIGVFIAFIYVYEHYLFGIITKFAGSDKDPRTILETIASLIFRNNNMSFNIFIDLFLCTLLNFFINYHPKKYFQGKKIYLFRSFSIFPILYEITSVVIKTYAVANDVTLNPYIYPFLTTKSPILFICFIILVLFIKNRERVFLKIGGKLEDYPAFLKTNANSLHFSIFATILFTSAAIIDIIASFIGTTIIAAGMETPELTTEEVVLLASTKANALGLGQTIPLLFVSPIFMLFSYTRRHEKRIIDVIIPIAAIILTAFVYIEGLYWVIVLMPA